MNVRIRDGQWHYRFNFRGREYSGPTGLSGDDSNRSEAQAVAERRRAEVQRQRPAAVAVVKTASIDPGFEGAAHEFLAWCKDTEYRAHPNTAERLRVSFVSLCHFFGETPLRRIDAAAVESFKANRATVDQVRDVTIRHDLHALSVFFRKWVCRRMPMRNPVAPNPVTGVREVIIPSDREAIREHVVSAEEEKAYFETAAALHAQYAKSFKDARLNLGDLARLMLEQGMRPEEMLAARTSAFDGARRMLRIEGGKSRAARRTLHLTVASCAVLERRAGLGSEWLFPSDRHPGRHITNLSCTHDRVCRDAGVSFRLYDFRHTFATRAMEAGVPVAVVAAILGHSGLRTIHRYVHALAEAQKAGMVAYEAAAEKRRAG